MFDPESIPARAARSALLAVAAAAMTVGGCGESRASGSGAADGDGDALYAETFWSELATDATDRPPFGQVARCEPGEPASGPRIELVGPPPAAMYNAAAATADSDLDPAETDGDAGAPAALVDGAVRAIVALARQRARLVPVADPRLHAAAAELAGLVPRSGRLPLALVEIAAWRHGVIDESPETLVMWGRLFDVPAMLDQLARELPALLGRGGVHRVGVGAVERDGRDSLGAGVMVVLFQASYLDTAPIARELPAGGAIRIEGTVRQPYTGVEVAVERVGAIGALGAGRARQTAAVAMLGARGGGARFRAEADCGGYRGRAMVSITGIGDGLARPVRIARFPVWCHRRAPERVAIPVGDDDDPAATPAQLEARALVRINLARERCGLSAIALDPRLAALARARSEAAAGLAAAPSSLSEALRGASIPTTAARGFAAQSYSMLDIETGLREEPSYRDTANARGVTHAGIGVVAEYRGGHREYFATVLLARIPAAMSTEQVHAEVTERLLAARPLVGESAAQTTAAAAADMLASGHSAESAVDWAVRELRAISRRYLHAVVLIWTVSDPAEFEPGPEVRRKGAMYYGVGVARGQPGTSGASAFHIVVVLGQVSDKATSGGDEHAPLPTALDPG